MSVYHTRSKIPILKYSGTCLRAPPPPPYPPLSGTFKQGQRQILMVSSPNTNHHKPGLQTAFNSPQIMDTVALEQVLFQVDNDLLLKQQATQGSQQDTPNQNQQLNHQFGQQQMQVDQQSGQASPCQLWRRPRTNTMQTTAARHYPY